MLKVIVPVLSPLSVVPAWSSLPGGLHTTEQTGHSLGHYLIYLRSEQTKKISGSRSRSSGPSLWVYYSNLAATNPGTVGL